MRPTANGSPVPQVPLRVNGRGGAVSKTDYVVKENKDDKKEKIMETTRQQKISRLIQKELSDIFQRQTQVMHGMLVSVSAVRISPDLSIAKIYLSIFPSEKAQETLANISANQRSIRYELGKRVRFQLRIIPELKFFQDDTLDYLDHIDELLAKDKPGGENERPEQGD